MKELAVFVDKVKERIKRRGCLVVLLCCQARWVDDGWVDRSREESLPPRRPHGLPLRELVTLSNNTMHF